MPDAGEGLVVKCLLAGNQRPAGNENPVNNTLIDSYLRSADSAPASDYDSFAEGYSSENKTSLLNVYYERPVMPELVGEVAGRSPHCAIAVPP